MSSVAGTASVIGLFAVAGVALSAPGPSRPGRRGLGRLGLRRSERRQPDPARWARPRDLRRLAVPARRDGGGSATGRLVLGRCGRQLLAAERAQSVIVFGPTQSHKTSGFAVPAVLGWDGAVVAASVKTDLLEHTIGHRRSLGEVLCFDPTGSTGLGSVSWSPLPAARTWPGARRSAAAMTEVVKTGAGPMSDGDFWYATAARMLAPLLFAAAFGHLGMDDVVRWVGTEEESEVLALLVAAGVPDAVHMARSTFSKEDRQRGSIYTTVETVLEPFVGANPVTADRAGAPGATPATLDAARLLSASNTLYVCAPAHDQRRLTPLFVSLLRQIVEEAYERVTMTRRALDPPLLLVLDEAANIAPLNDLDALAATAAGHGVQLVTIWHDLAQVRARYGPRAGTVVNNHRAKLFLSGISDPDTLDHASRLIGEEEVAIPTTTSGGRAGPSTTRAPSTRRLAPPDALRRTRPGRGILVYGDLPPVRLALRPWYSDPGLQARVGVGGARGRPGVNDQKSRIRRSRLTKSERRGRRSRIDP
ncbi:MAG TPA: type IV secretory system conjugative DNA transfer family protein [Acidimicrobiales bacterium]|nr:type IV secretory system conjugative DNA transfer family protein [Acidimicrobiales bacterium]